MYQFELRDCSHISCHKEARISLVKKYKSFKFTVATGRWLQLFPVATLGHWQEGPLKVAMDERHHLPIASETGPACQWPNEATKKQVSPITLSEMKTYDVKKSYCPQPTRVVDRGREEFVNSLKIYWSWQIPILYNQSLQFFCRSINLKTKIIHIFNVIDMQEIL
jgi:hypothetical protein